MREIKRNQYMRGTLAYKYRNRFIFAGLSITVLSYIGLWFMLDTKNNRMVQQMHEENDERKRYFERIAEIKERRLKLFHQATSTETK